MAKAIKKIESEETVKEGNIKDLAELYREFKEGNRINGRKFPMDAKKLVALTRKLVSLFNDGSITEDEQSLMEEILRRERNKGTIHLSDNYLLNEIEAARIEDLCTVKTDDAPMVHHLKKGMECKFIYDSDFDDKKNKPDSIGRYYVYVSHIVPPDHQYSYDLALKELKHHPTSPEDYPKPKLQVKRRVFKEKEFDAWFEANDPDILTRKGVSKEEEYQF